MERHSVLKRKAKQAKGGQVHDWKPRRSTDISLSTLLGIKYRPEYSCGFVASLTATKCPVHENIRLCYSTAEKGECPIEFCYIHPTDIATDHRRWIAGFVLNQREPSSNLYNHSQPSPSKFLHLSKKELPQL